jgi:hypothetical protein
MLKPPLYDAFVAFLRAEPEQKYNACDTNTCAMALFLRRQCVPHDEVEILGSSSSYGPDGILYKQIFDTSETFGALADRLEAAEPWAKPEETNPELRNPDWLGHG